MSLSSEFNKFTAEDVIEHLSKAIDDYIKEDPRKRSVNSLSKKCAVSEATLRRIYNRKVKLSPNVHVCLDILTSITDLKSIKKICEIYQGPIDKYLRSSLPDASFLEISHDRGLKSVFDNPNKYLIYKLSANNSGVSTDKVKEIFGEAGLILLRELAEEGFVKREEAVYKSANKHFQSTQGDFAKNFKAVADFIKPLEVNKNSGLNSVRVNYSESVSEKTYKQIVAIQRKAISKIRDLMADEKNAGDIPAFLLVGLDTLDPKSFEELVSLKKQDLKNKI